MENDLKFSGESPVVIDYNGSADDIYAPIRTSSADVNIVSEHILDDLYTARKNEICVGIQKKKKLYDKVFICTSRGSCSSIIISNDQNVSSYSIYQKNQFYKDINGNFRFNGIIRNNDGVNYPVNLLFDYDTKHWTIDNYWWLDTDQTKKNQYFCDTTDKSYKVEWDGTSHYISTWSSGSWTNRSAYIKIEDGVSSDMAYGCDYIVNVNDDHNELIFGKKRYTWNSSQRRWEQTTSFTDSDGDDYTAMYGSWCMKVNDGDRNLVDACIVNGLDGSDWIVKLNRTTNKFTRMIEIESSYDLDNIFSDNGNIYCIKNSGDLYVWSWDANAWCKWVTFSGDSVDGSFYLDYTIPSPNGKQYVIKYTNSNTNKTDVILLGSLNPPTYDYEKVWTGYYNTVLVWEGYKMPNTYSQDVTQNLDTINMVCIDPVSIMKYVTVDKLFTKPNIVSYGEMIGKALAYVTIHANKLYVERTVLYGSSTYFGDNGLMDLRCQVSNFWDESDKPSSLYDVIEELLKPFCLTLVYEGGDTYRIYSNNKTGIEEASTFDKYKIESNGSLTYLGEVDEDRELFDFSEDDWISNNTQEATVEINNTYDKVNGIANTSIPSYSKMAFDLVDITQTDKYSYGGLNVQRNKTKGYVKRNGIVTTETADKWYYLWNGVYVNEDYDLESWNGYTDWYINMQQAYQYLNDGTTPSADFGAILNFYGGSNNTTATGKSQTTDKSVQVSKRITAYAPDNGVPPEFLELSDLEWTGHVSDSELRLAKQNTSNTKFGDGIVMGESNRIIYHQEYENINMTLSNNPIVDIDIVRSFSRTGINVPIDVMNNNTTTGNTYNIWGNFTGFSSGNYFPQPWNWDSVVVNSIYFRRYAGSGTIRVKPVWDSRRIDLYIKLSNDTILQFNGTEWVEDTEVRESNAFYLQKLMNYEKLFHTDNKYDIIEVSSGSHYSLTGEVFTYYTDGNGYVYDHNAGTAHECQVYESGYWNPGSGSFSITLPEVDDVAPVVCVDVYNSSMLGMTGCDDIGGSYTNAPFYYALGGGEFTRGVYIDFLPKNLSHVKAEHLDLSISITVPESNLGQMFSQSDIEYVIDSKKTYVEQYDGPSFQVNTQNPLVISSYSYLLYGNVYADPGEFIVNNINTRPESYTVQAYFNWLSRTRKIYTKTLVPLKDTDKQFNNIMTFITTPEIGDNEMMVISDSWDLKTDRHSITAIEADHLEVDYVSQFLVNELPHKARAERWNLPTVNKS